MRWKLLKPRHCLWGTFAPNHCSDGIFKLLYPKYWFPMFFSTPKGMVYKVLIGLGFWQQKFILIFFLNLILVIFFCLSTDTNYIYFAGLNYYLSDIINGCSLTVQTKKWLKIRWSKFEAFKDMKLLLLFSIIPYKYHYGCKAAFFF